MNNFINYQNKGLTGLKNIGNSCYINSCIQLISNIYELNDYLDSLNLENLNNNIDSILLKEWDSLRKMIWSKNCTIVPMRFLKIIEQICLKKNYLDFLSNDQCDVGEFLLFLIDCFHNSMKYKTNIEIIGESKNELDTLAIECYKLIKNTYSEEYSKIIDLFYGISITFIRSLDNNNNILSKCCEVFSILNMSIPLKDNCDIYDCFDEYIKNEILKDENAWYNEEKNVKKML